MAESVTVERGDTLVGILKKKRGIANHEAPAWLPGIRNINPHIRDLNRLYPGERLLIPDSRNDIIPDQKIWQNALSRVPESLKYNRNTCEYFYLTQPGDTIDSIAEMIFKSTPSRNLPASSKRAIFLCNNLRPGAKVSANAIPVNTVVNTTPAPLSQSEKDLWRTYQTPLEINFKNLDLETRAVYRDIGPEETYTLSELVRTLEDAGAAIGTDGAVRFASYGVGAASAYAASGNMALAEVNGLTRELYAEAVETLGEKVVKSKNSAQLAKVEAFLKRHPKYNRLMSNLKELPRKILPEGKLFPATNTRDPFFHARHFRKQFVLPYSKHNVSRYVDTIGRRLNGKIGYFKAMGRATTWVIPAVLGAATVASAPPELRVRTAVAEGSGIAWGAIGTMVGASGATLGAKAAISVAFGLTISPAGLFVVALIGGAVLGAALYEGGKWGGAKLYDAISNRQNEKAIQVPDMLMKCH